MKRIPLSDEQLSRVRCVRIQTGTVFRSLSDKQIYEWMVSLPYEQRTDRDIVLQRLETIFLFFSAIDRAEVMRTVDGDPSLTGLRDHIVMKLKYLTNKPIKP